jgi:glyceraldehyde 3-phosphate dehydrogenase
MVARATVPHYNRASGLGPLLSGPEKKEKTVATRVAINGFGRIGRLTFRNLMSRRDEFEVVAINDLTDNKTLATLLKYDSIHRRYDGSVDFDDDHLIVDGQKIKALAERNPLELPWAELGVDVVVESTGVFTGRQKDGKPGYDSHLTAGAKKVVLSAPAKDEPDLTCVLGVNDDRLTGEMRCISNASCTTNCLAPLVHVLLKEGFGIDEGLMTTVHSYTATQKTVDGPSKKDWKGGRAAAMNIIPSTTGAARAVALVCPEVKGKLTGMAFRVPTATVSAVDLTVKTVKETSYAEISAAMKRASETYLKGILDYTEDEVVSSDFIHSPASSIFDAGSGIELNKRFFKLIGWYDNEWGYSCRVSDLVKYVIGKGL